MCRNVTPPQLVHLWRMMWWDITSLHMVHIFSILYHGTHQVTHLTKPPTLQSTRTWYWKFAQHHVTIHVLSTESYWRMTVHQTPQNGRTINANSNLQAMNVVMHESAMQKVAMRYKEHSRSSKRTEYERRSVYERQKCTRRQSSGMEA